MTSTATTSDSFVKRLQTIEHLISSGKLAEAAQRLNAASKSSPRDARVYLLGSRLAEAAGNPQGAQDAARRAIKSAPDWLPALVELASLLARQNQFSEAMELAQRAVTLDGNNLELLTRVIDIAHRTRHFDMAIVWLERAAALAPGDLEIMRRLARDLGVTGQHSKAQAIHDRLVEALPDHREVRLGRAFNALKTGDLAKTLADCEALLTRDPDDEVAQFFSELARGNTPTKQPASMVRSIFDQYADHFDQHLVIGLKYKLPREVATMINDRYPDRKLNVLDLGCGTGLLGACLGRIDGALVGVELSRAMIEQAIKHDVYDRFHSVDLLEALEATPESLYHVIAALDVFVYVGDLASAIPNAYRILRGGGHFIFSCEQAQEDEADLVMRPTQRYAHKASHVEALCRAAGFEEVTLELKRLRYENDEPQHGFLVIAKKTAAANAPQN